MMPSYYLCAAHMLDMLDRVANGDAEDDVLAGLEQSVAGAMVTLQLAAWNGTELALVSEGTVT